MSDDMFSPNVKIDLLSVLETAKPYIGDLNTFRNVCHDMAKEKGWWDEGVDRSTGTLLMLMVTELAEAMEEHRKGHPPDYTYHIGDKPFGVPSELADVLIRIFDFCGHHGIDLQSIVLEKIKYNATRSHRHGGKVV